MVQPKATLPSIAEFLGKYLFTASLKHPLHSWIWFDVVAGLRFVLTCPSCSKVSCSRWFGRDLVGDLSLSNLRAKRWWPWQKSIVLCTCNSMIGVIWDIQVCCGGVPRTLLYFWPAAALRQRRICGYVQRTRHPWHYFGPSKFLLTCCITTPCVYVTQSFHDNNIIPIYCIHSYDMQSACFRALGAILGKHKKKYIEILEDPRQSSNQLFRHLQEFVRASSFESWRCLLCPLGSCKFFNRQSSNQLFRHLQEFVQLCSSFIFWGWTHGWDKERETTDAMFYTFNRISDVLIHYMFSVTSVGCEKISESSIAPAQTNNAKSAERSITPKERLHGNQFMCESMLECEELVYTTWWWIPVLEASRSSRLSLVGYTSCPAHTTEDVQKYADTLDPGQFLYFWLLQTVLYPITYCCVVIN